MTLTLGTGPFAKPGKGALNFDLNAAAPAHVLFLHEVPKRVRALLGGETVVDSRRTQLLHETGLLPQLYVPFDDVRMDLLEQTAKSTHCPFKGDARYWTVRVGERVEEDVVWSYPEPLTGAPPLAGLAAFYFDRMDAWYEEDEELVGHMRDPFHRVDTRAGSRHVVVRVGGEVVAETNSPVMLFETGLPVRYYLPVDGVREDLLEPSETTSVCPYKGTASYASVRTGGDRGGDIGGDRAADVAWTYREPLGEALQVAGLWSFLGDDVDIDVTDPD